MAYIKAFRGIRYSLTDGPDVSDRISAPYDVLGPEDKERLLRQSPYNIVKIDLPYIPPKKAGPEEIYKKAGKIFFEWLDKKILVQDEVPTIYAYRQRFSWAGREYIRRGFIAALRLEEFGKGSIYPHEKTYGGPKEDRFLLTKYTQANISQVFCLYDDPGNKIIDTLYSELTYPPMYYGRIGDVDNEVWLLTNEKIISFLTQQFKGKSILIADGHHRYSTAIMYRDYLKAQGRLWENHPANYVSCVFVSMDEPGLIVLPTHRLISCTFSISSDWLKEALKDKFDLEEIVVKNPQDLQRRVEEGGISSLGFIFPPENIAIIAHPKETIDVLSDLAGEHTEDWRRLSTAILHYYIIDKLMPSSEFTIEYYHRAEELFSALQNAPVGTFGVITSTIPVEVVKKISLAGELMPQKSTYFYPKVATGLVIYPLFESL